MRGRTRIARLVLAVGFLPIASAARRSGSASIAEQERDRTPGQNTARCTRARTVLKIAAGQSVRRQVADDLDVALEAHPSGWFLRVLPHRGPLPVVDFAEIATPPYRSVNPLLLTTDFGFRAQDVIGWNPREFRFVTSWKRYARLEPAYRAVTKTDKALKADEMKLLQRLREAAAGEIAIVDATLAPGIADQSRAAAGVSSRFNQTPHMIVSPEGTARAAPLGRILTISVRVSLDLPGHARQQHLSEVETQTVPCALASP